MPKTTAFLEAVEDLIFNNANIANVGDATGLRGSSSAGVLYLSLHSSSPGLSGTQSTNEVSYTGYARQSVARSGGAWTRTGADTSPTANVQFPSCTGGSVTATYAGIGTDATGSGTLLYYGAISPTIAISSGIIPILTNTSTITES